MARPSDLSAEVRQVLEDAEGALTTPVSGRPDMLDDQRRTQQEARRIEAMSLTLAGLSAEVIAERMGISASGVRALVSRTLERAANRNVEQLREIENARLDRAQAAIWTKVLEGDLKALDSFLRLSSRRARLNGLDAPTNINLSIGIRHEMQQALETLEGVVMGEVVDDDVRADEGGQYGDAAGSGGDDRAIEGTGGGGD